MKLRHLDDSKVLVSAGKLIKDLRCGIARAIVDSDNLVPWIILGQLRRQSLRQVGGLVAGSEQYRDPRALGVRQRRNAGKPWDSGHPSTHAQTKDAPPESNRAKKPDPQVVHKPRSFQRVGEDEIVRPVLPVSGLSEDSRNLCPVPYSM
jgi:hypothetical protein